MIAMAYRRAQPYFVPPTIRILSSLFIVALYSLQHRPCCQLDLGLGSYESHIQREPEIKPSQGTGRNLGGMACGVARLSNPFSLEDGAEAQRGPHFSFSVSFSLSFPPPCVPPTRE